MDKDDIEGQHGEVVKADSTQTGNPGLIPIDDKAKWYLAPSARQDNLLYWFINRNSLYHCTIWANKISLKVSKCVGLPDMLVKLY